MPVKIYDKHNIDHFNWNEYEDGESLRVVFEPLIRLGTRPFIANVDNEVQILVMGKVILPLVIGNPQARQNAYICSTLSQYFDLAIEEIVLEMKGKKSVMAAIAPPALRLLRYFFKILAFERVVFVNNLILSTNLYPELDHKLLNLAREALTQKFPKHALVFRSINESLDQEIHRELLSLHFQEIISRPVLVLDPSQKTYLKKRMYKMDQKLWEKNKNYYWDKHESIRPDEIPRIRKLYEALYLQKYSSLNPQYLDNFIALLLESKLLDFSVLRKEGEIYGVTAFLERNGVLTTPFIGYEQQVPIEEGLYRFLNYHLMQEAIEKRLILNMSSGAANFKRLRGGESSLEYNMVYFKHLPFRFRIPWQMYHLISSRIAIPNIRKYNL